MIMKRRSEPKPGTRLAMERGLRHAMSRTRRALRKLYPNGQLPTRLREWPGEAV